MTRPGDILDLDVWKLTLPVGQSGKPQEIKQPTLATYRHDEYFTVSSGGGVRFRAPVTGVTTSGSKYPRCELREMTPKGDQAKWSTTDGVTHRMFVEMAFTRLPTGKPHVVGAQIHGGSDDVTVLRLEGPKLWVTRGDDKYKLIDDNYQLGTRFSFGFVAEDGVVTCYYQGRVVAAIAARVSSCFFKTGAYVQANKSNAKPADSSNYGETVLYKVEVSHGARPVSVPAPQPEPTNRTVMVIRHGEKPESEDDHTLSARGRERASKLAWLFTRNPNPLGLPRPERLFASKGDTASMRMVQTLQPVSRALGLPISSQFDSEEQIDETANWLEVQPGVTLACLEREAILGVARRLGPISAGMVPDIDEWPSDRFDLFWIFTQQSDGTWHFRQVGQMLMIPGDRPIGIS